MFNKAEADKRVAKAIADVTARLNANDASNKRKWLTDLLYQRGFIRRLQERTNEEVQRLTTELVIKNQTPNSSVWYWSWSMMMMMYCVQASVRASLSDAQTARDQSNTLANQFRNERDCTQHLKCLRCLF